LPPNPILEERQATLEAAEAAYRDIIEEWKREQAKPRPSLADDFSDIAPTYALVFSVFPAEQGFDASEEWRTSSDHG
jgi:hypothetical protein